MQFRQAAITDEPVNSGDSVLLFGPEPVTKTRPVLARMGAIEGRVEEVTARAFGWNRTVQS